MGCRYLMEKVAPQGGTPLCITGHLFRQKYGYELSDGNVIEELCSSCAHVIALASKIAETDLKSAGSPAKS